MELYPQKEKQESGIMKNGMNREGHWVAAKSKVEKVESSRVWLSVVEPSRAMVGYSRLWNQIEPGYRVQ